MNHRWGGLYVAACALGIASILSAACSDDSSPSGKGTIDGGSSGTSGGTSGTSGTSGGPDDSGTSGGPGDSGADIGKDAAALCDPTIPAAAPEFTDTFTAASMPPTGTATGGAIESGTYLQIEQKNYEKASGTAKKRKGVITFDATAKTFTLAGSEEGTVGSRGGTYSIAGNKLTMNFTCPTTASATFEFSYNAPKFELYNYGAKHIDAFTKQ